MERFKQKGKSELIDKLCKILKIPFDVIDHQAGIRPTVIDRRPIIGLHPEFQQIGIFNGMGTKAVMIAPYFAREFYNYLEGSCSLHKEVCIERFYKYKKDC